MVSQRRRAWFSCTAIGNAEQPPRVDGAGSPRAVPKRSRRPPLVGDGKFSHVEAERVERGPEKGE